ncbi:o-succinylbenzoate synthase [Bacillus sp. FJAT-47783]|uniref:o-succinylbenzoate synthase n=1 Tax=Bacillus sp. FJAT-47783 TaxID=2922712 RepID=UPI001FAD36B9
MTIQEVKIYHVEMELKTPFQTSLETVRERESLIIEAIDTDGVIGWGEVVAFSSPWYTEETVQTTYHILKDFLVPIVLKKTFAHPNDLQRFFQLLKRNHMAKAGIELAVWDLFAKRQNLALSNVLGGTRREIEAGVVISIDSIPKMLTNIEKHVEEGYKRFKVKISPHTDYSLLKEIRTHFPDLPLMVDANSAYTLKDVKKLQALDEFHLLMIEQPLRSDDFVEHRDLQKLIKTPICLDESIHSLHDAYSAILLNSCQIINVKAGRVGGLSESKRIHDLCGDYNIPIWCGGMLETGISRAHNIALASLPNFTIPGDISASSRYWKEDIIEPEVTVTNGVIHIPEKPGIGYEVNRKKLKKYSRYYETFT